MANENQEVTLRIQRFNPDVDEKPYLQYFQIQSEKGMTVLDALHKVKTEQDGSVTFRRSCRHGICGSCAMNINGRNTLTCNTPLRDVINSKGEVTIRPLPYLPVIKDLVVDRTDFWEQYQRMKPWLIPKDDVPEKEHRMSPEEVKALDRAETCIMCGACYSTCVVIDTTKEYIGPHALLKAFLRVVDPRDNGTEERLEDLAGADGVHLCLACKGCKLECPIDLDMAKLKSSFLERYYRSHPRKLRDYLFGYFHWFGQLGSWTRPLVNALMNTQAFWNKFARLFKLAPQRRLPKFRDRGSEVRDQEIGGRELVPCLLLSDAFSEHFYPHRLDVAVDVLARAGYRAEILPVVGAGRTLISKGFRKAAKRHARKLVAAIDELDPEGRIPIIGLEPSEIYTLSDEYPDFFPGNESVARMAKRAWMIDEFLVRDDRLETYLTNLQNADIPITDLPTANVLLHGHCYQKARPPADDGEPVGVEASVALLETLGYSVEVVDSGCCGMAGAFGYEAEHYDLSMHVGEVALFPAVRAADAKAIVAASGVSCQSQIEDGAGRKAVHPVELIAHKVRVLEEQDEEKSQVVAQT